MIHFPIHMLLIEEDPFNQFAPAVSLTVISAITILVSVLLAHLDRLARGLLPMRTSASRSA